MAHATVSSKYQITIPGEVRRALGLKPGDNLLVVLKGNVLILRKKPKSFADALKGIGRRLYPADYLDKARESWD